MADGVSIESLEYQFSNTSNKNKMESYLQSKKKKFIKYPFSISFEFYFFFSFAIVCFSGCFGFFGLFCFVLLPQWNLYYYRDTIKQIYCLYCE